MKALLCSDIHNPASDLVLLREKSLGVDFIICAGDMGVFGRELDKVLKEFNSWGKPVFVIHGNHEDSEETKRICDSLRNVTFFHGDVVDFHDLKLIGWGGGGFSFRDKGFETCLDEKNSGVFVGNESFKHFIVKHKPLIAVSGHIHETSGLVCNLDGVVLINPGPEGVIIEL